MILTIGMPSYNNYQEVWFTVQALRLYQDLEDCEIIIIDNYGKDERLKKMIRNKENVRIVEWTVKQGSGVPRNRIFEHAQGDWVINLDSHVMLRPNAISDFKKWAKKNPDCKDLFHGPMLYDNLKIMTDSYQDKWQGNAWGVWNASRVIDPAEKPFEIKMMGIGCFGCRKDAWQGFNEDFIGFGGVEGYIHEKHRQAGYKVICLPFLQWLHYFRNQHGIQEPVPFQLKQEDRVHNYLLGFRELGMDLTPVYDLYGKNFVDRVDQKYFSDEKEVKKFVPAPRLKEIKDKEISLNPSQDFILNIIKEFKIEKVIEFGSDHTDSLNNVCRTITYETRELQIKNFKRKNYDIRLWELDSFIKEEADLTIVNKDFDKRTKEKAIELASNLSKFVLVSNAFKKDEIDWQNRYLQNKQYTLLKAKGVDDVNYKLWIKGENLMNKKETKLKKEKDKGQGVPIEQIRFKENVTVLLTKEEQDGKISKRFIW